MILRRRTKPDGVDRRDLGVATTLRRATTDDFDQLFELHHPRLVRALTAASGDPQLAADCVADAFERAFVRWRKIARYDDPAGWVRHVAVNRLRDHQRREGRRERALTRLRGGERSEPMSGLAEVEDLLGSLPEQQRLSVALHHVAGLPVAEVAAAMGIAEGTVKYHLHAGRQALRSALSGSEER